MKKILTLVIITFGSQLIQAQTAYIQVTGEPDLSVYLNNQFKGKTTVEYNGYIIENVTAGKNLIKIEKEGYTPFEETINVKAGEVFSYKVKPFTKHSVYISEQGNTGQTEKKAVVETGKLIVQSVPIEIKISIPEIEGIDNKLKTKDEWILEKVPQGNYKVIFSFNQKVIEKNITIKKDDEISVFVNMLNGDFKVVDLAAEKRLKKSNERAKAEQERVQNEKLAREKAENDRLSEERWEKDKAERRRKDDRNDFLINAGCIAVGILTAILMALYLQ